MAFAYLLDPQNQYMTKSGAINTAGIIRVFDASTDDPAVTYKDFNGTANPEAIVLDNNGRCVCIADADKAYRVEVYDRYNSLMWTTSPLWCEAAGGGVQLNITELVSSDGSVDLVKTTVGSTTTWDLSVAKDSTQMLEWLKAEGYTVVETGHYLPTYSSGSMQVGEYGVALHANQYYHFTSHFIAVVSNPSDPIYDSIEVVFRTADAILYTKKFTVDCTTALPQEFEVSFDVMAGSDMEVGVFVGDIDSNTVSVGLSDMEVHRVYSGAPYIPDGIASREWVEDNYQEKLTAGANIVIEDNVISATAEPQLNADWDATSGVSMILNKPEIPPDNVYVATYNTTTYQELSAAHAAGKVIFVTGVPSVLSAVIPMTSFVTNPAMVMFSTVIGSDEYSAKIDQGIWSYNNVSIQADWNQPFALTPSYINNKPTIPSGAQLVPPATSADANKVLKVNALGAPDWAALATVALTGSYNDLSNTPSIPVIGTITL